MKKIVFFLCIFYPFIIYAQNDWEYLGPFNSSDNPNLQNFGYVGAINVNPENDNEIYIGSGSSGLFYTNDRGKNWTCLTDNFDLPLFGVKDIIIDYSTNPRTLLIANGFGENDFDTPMWGVLKSTDGGKTWQQKMKNENNAILYEPMLKFFQPKDKNKIFVLSKNQILVSTNFGNSWQEIFSFPEGMKEYEMRDFFINEEGTTLFFSTATKWINGKIEPAHFYEIHQINYTSKNNNFELIDEKLNALFNPDMDNKIGTYTIRFEKNNSNPNQLLIARNLYGSKTNFTIYDFDIEKGKCVNYQNNTDNSKRFDLYWHDGIKINQLNPKINYVASMTLFKSKNNGETYEELFPYSTGDKDKPHCDLRKILITKYSEDGESDEIYLGTDGGLSYSKNGGKTWENLSGKNLPITQFFGLGSSPFNGILSGGTQDNSIMTYLPKEKKWLRYVLGDGYDVDYSKTTPGFAAGQYNDQHIGFTYNDMVPFNNFSNLRKQPNVRQTQNLQFLKNGNLYHASEQFHVFEKEKNEWQLFPYAHLDKSKTGDFAVSEIDPEIIYASGYWKGFIKSENGGKTWENISVLKLKNGETKEPVRIVSICVSPNNKDDVWIGIGYLGDYFDVNKPTNRIYYSDDGGKTWEDYSTGLGIFPISDLKFLDGSLNGLLASTMTGVYFREGKFDTWKKIGTGLPKCIVSEIELNYCMGKILVSTYGRGIWSLDIPKIKYKQEKIIRKSEIWKMKDSNDVLLLTQDVELKKKANLIIDTKVHMPKAGKIIVHNKNQITFTKNGELVNDCGEVFEGIILK